MWGARGQFAIQRWHRRGNVYRKYRIIFHEMPIKTIRQEQLCQLVVGSKTVFDEQKYMPVYKELIIPRDWIPIDCDEHFSDEVNWFSIILFLASFKNCSSIFKTSATLKSHRRVPQQHHSTYSKDNVKLNLYSNQRWFSSKIIRLLNCAMYYKIQTACRDAKIVHGLFLAHILSRH